MSDLLLWMAPECVLQIAEVTAEPTAAGWTEEDHLEIVAKPSCPWVEIALPPGVTLGERRGRQRLGDGTGGRIAEDRWEELPRSVHGAGRVRVHLPELVGGDRVFLDFTRLHPPGPLEWRPGAARFVAAETGEGSIAAPPGSSSRYWTRDAPADLVVRFDDGRAADPRPSRWAAVPTRREQRLSLIVPGHPQYSLVPGGGSTVAVTEELVFPARSAESAWPLDAEGPVSLEARPPGSAALEEDESGARIVLPASDATAKVVVSWTAPDAPAHGERPPEVDRLTVEGREVLVEWEAIGPPGEGDAWFLRAVGDEWVLPDRDRLVAALDWRFRTAALPEPGAPVELRHAGGGWEAAARLRSALLDRVAVGTWPADPLFPRKLVRARRTGAVTSVEAALIAWLYARQLRLDADWALVRPATRGPGPAIGPAGYDTGLVRISEGGEERWIDLGCRPCAPFELRPELEGASAIGPRGIARTPPPTPGRVEVVEAASVPPLPGGATWDLQGPAALDLRLWLEPIPPAERPGALARLLGGPGAELVAAEGVGEAGAPIHLVVAPGEGLRADPLSLPSPGADGTVWFPWVGERIRRGPERDLPDVDLTVGALRYVRLREGGQTVERLEVSARLVPASDVAAIELARRPPAPEVSPPEPGPAPP